MAAALVSPRRIKKNRHRWRRSASGRTVYAYVGGNPVNLVDPLGLEGIGPWTYAPGQNYGGTQCQGDAIAGLMLNSTPITAAGNFLKDALGISINFNDGFPSVSIFDYDAVGTGAAAAGYTVEGAANGLYNGHIDNMARRAGDTSIPYQLRNAASNRMATSMGRKAVVSGVGKALGPAGAAYQFGQDLNRCGCK